MKNIFLTLAALLLIGHSISYGQIVTPNVFLKGQYVEVGMQGNGSFGVNSSPAGYHAHPNCCGTIPVSGGGLGIVHDWGHDGWSVGSTQYMGDYTFAGNPFEGWELQVGSGRAQAFQSTGVGYASSGLALTGAITGYANQCGNKIATWSGTAAGTLNMEMETRVDTTASWVVMTVKMKNAGSAPLTDIYYLRSCDPDGDQTWTGGGFPTNNTVVYQNDLLHRVLVSATAPAHPYSYMGLGTKDSRAVAFIYNMWPLMLTVDLATIWNQTYSPAFYNVGVNHPGDIGIGLVFKLGTLAAGDSTCFSYSYTFGGIPDIDSVAGSLTATNNGPVCVGDTLKLFSTTTAGACGYSWYWYGPAGFTSTMQNPVIPNVTSAAAGVYHVVHRSLCTAYDTATTTVVITPAPLPITGNPSICVGATTTLADATPGGTWSSSAAFIATISPAGVVTGISAGTSIITYSVSAGCYVTFVINVYNSPAPLTGVVLCEGQTTTMTNATPGGTWSSSNSGIASIGATSGTLTGVGGGTANITYSFSPTCYVTAVVTVNPLPNPGVINGPSGLCIGDVITLTDSVPGGVWSGGNSSASVSLGVVTGLSAGTALISYTISNGCGTVSATKLITVTAMPVITGRLSMCVGDTTMLTEDLAGGIWRSSDTATATVNSGIVHGVKAGTAVISYFIDSGCKATVVVTVNPLPNAGVISGGGKICVGATLQLTETVSGGKWYSGDTGKATIDSLTGLVTAKALGTVTIRYTIGPNANGCVNTALFTLTIAPPSFVINYSIIALKCYGDTNASITINVTGGTGPYQYLWSTGGVTNSIGGLAPGVYAVTVNETTTKCIKADSFGITQPDSLSVTRTVSNDICQSKNGSIHLNVSGGTTPYSYLWSTNATGSEILAVSAGVYSVTVTDKNGCTEQLAIEVTDSCTGLIIHNATSPNGDGINDTWVIEGIEQYPTNTVQVFDKWGDLIFEQANYRNDWAGKGKKGPLPDGTYYYLIKLNSSNPPNGKGDYTGYMMIKR